MHKQRTLRNGNPAKDKKPYAEKIMIVEENQETPMHYHWNKIEEDEAPVHLLVSDYRNYF